MSDWSPVGECLVRHKGGTIYLRASVAGKCVRVSLQTSDLRIAKLKRDAKLDELRAAALEKKHSVKLSTLGDVVSAAMDRLDLPHLKPATAHYYRQLAEIIRRTLPVAASARSWTSSQAAAWWRQCASGYSAQRANNLLSFAKNMGKLMVELRIRTDDPTAALKRVRIQKSEPDLPSYQELIRIIESIRSQRKRSSIESANFVAFLAFSGCRHGEAKACQWEHVGEEWLTITGGEHGTKGGEVRRVPISAPLRAVLDGMSYDGASGPIFSISSPRIAFAGACRRLGRSTLRLHDLRHFFATWCIESGVEIPTVAKWLGHKDGGVLLMRTYGHLRDQHSLDQAKKLG